MTDNDQIYVNYDVLERGTVSLRHASYDLDDAARNLQTPIRILEELNLSELEDIIGQLKSYSGRTSRLAGRSETLSRRIHTVRQMFEEADKTVRVYAEELKLGSESRSIGPSRSKDRLNDPLPWFGENGGSRPFRIPVPPKPWLTWRGLPWRQRMTRLDFGRMRYRSLLIIYLSGILARMTVILWQPANEFIPPWLSDLVEREQA